VTVVSNVTLRYAALGAKETARQDKWVRDSVTRTGKRARREQGTVEAWFRAHRRALIGIGAAMAGLLAGVILASPALRAEMASVRLAFSLLAMEIGEHLAPAFELLESAAWRLLEAYEALPAGLQAAIAWTIAFIGVLGSLLVLVGLLSGPVGKGAILIFTGIAKVLAFVAAGGVALAAIIGTLVGLFIVWILEVTGVLDAVARLGQAITRWIGGPGANLVRFIATTLMAPLIALGAVIVALVKGEGLRGAAANLRSIFTPWLATWLSIFQTIGGWFRDLARNALQWGTDIIVNMALGMLRAMGRLGDAARAARDTIAGWISFDVVQNDRMAQRWGRDMAQHFSRGILQGARFLDDALSIASPGLSTGASAGRPMPSGGGGGGTTISITLETGAIQLTGSEAQGMDVDRLAERIARQIGDRFGGRA
jgi:hypothetical protein